MWTLVLFLLPVQLQLHYLHKLSYYVPGTDAGLTFSWGGIGDESSVTADIPIVSLRLEEPVSDGMEVYLSMIVASPFGQMTAAHANTLELRINGAVVSGDPIVMVAAITSD